MNEAALLADGSDDGYRWTSYLVQGQLHPRHQPALGNLLPEMKRGLVNIDDLIVRLVHDNGP